jgi:hypothetical protein
MCIYTKATLNTEEAMLEALHVQLRIKEEQKIRRSTWSSEYKHCGQIVTAKKKGGRHKF